MPGAEPPVLGDPVSGSGFDFSPMFLPLVPIRCRELHPTSCHFIGLAVERIRSHLQARACGLWRDVAPIVLFCTDFHHQFSRVDTSRAICLCSQTVRSRFCAVALVALVGIHAPTEAKELLRVDATQAL